MRPLNILHTEASLGWGGQEIRIIQESRGMIKRGHRVVIAAPLEGVIFKKAEESGINIFPAHFQKRNPISVLRMRLLINRERFDVVNTHSSSDSWVASIAARLSRVKPKIIRTRHLSTPISKSYLSRLIYEILPHAVITTGEEIRQRMIKENGFNADKIFSIPTGIDLERFNPEKVKPAFQSKNPHTHPFNKVIPPNPPLSKGGWGDLSGGQGGLMDNFSVGMVGVLRSWKGHRYFIEAVPAILSVIPDSTFYIIGDGPQFQNIKDMIKNLSLEHKILMLGHRDDIPEILASLDAIVHPSYANEGVPQSILQAMAMGKPVVASDAGAIKEIVIDRETGFLIEPKNPNQLSERIIELYRNPELKIKFGKAGRRLVEENYSMEAMLDKIESLYEKLLKDKKIIYMPLKGYTF